MINVLLADDHHIVRAGLCRIVDESPDMAVAGEASNGKEAIKLARESRPDVAVIDLSMPEMDGLEVVSQLKNYYPDLPILILTMHEEEQYVVRALRMGAMGYITKRSAPEELVTAIKEVHRGERYVSRAMTEALAQWVARGGMDRTPLDSLTNREIQVLRGLAEGKTNKEIGEIYHISVKTVDSYRLRILKKLDLRNNVDLSRFAIQEHLIEI